jgi:CSLREA domain-containing protein
MSRSILLVLLALAAASAGSAQQRPSAPVHDDERTPRPYRGAVARHEPAPSLDAAREALLRRYEAEAEARRQQHAPAREARRARLLADLARLPKPERVRRVPQPAHRRDGATVFTVNSAYDEGDTGIDGVCANLFEECTLRAAIQEANAVAGADLVRIEFAITVGPFAPSPAGVWTILVNYDDGFGAFGPLPVIFRDFVTIDGTTQGDAACGDLRYGAAHTLRVFLDGTLVVDNASTAEDGLQTLEDETTVWGLAIGNFPDAGVGVRSIPFFPPPPVGVVDVLCSYVGTDAAGAAARPNGVGVFAGRPVAVFNSLVSGNDGDGIVLLDDANNPGANNSTISYSLVGTDAAGTAALGNGGIGISTLFVSDVYIGLLVGGGNVVSANGSIGISLLCGNCSIESNLVGTDKLGTADLGNGDAGIVDGSLSGDNGIVNNTVSGNAGSGIVFYGFNGFTSVPVFIGGNRVGTTATGTAPLGNDLSGIALIDAGDAVVRGNVSSANADAGIYLEDDVQASVVGTVLEGNFLGTDATGTLDLGNGLAGVYCFSAADVRVGSTTASSGNTIAFNDGDGIFLRPPCLRLALLTNRLYSNSGLGIDLAPNNVTGNDAGDADAGANDLTNFPVRLSVTNDGTSATVSFRLNALPNQRYRVELFTSASADPSAFGEGATFRTFATPMTNASGVRNVTITRAASLFPVGQWVAATATPVDGATLTDFRGTSEFGRAVQVQAARAPGDAAAVGTSEGQPDAYALHAAYPNPFERATTLRFDLPEPAHIRLSVYDVLGREVARLVDAETEAGAHAVRFEGARLPSGTYLVRLEAGGRVRTQRITLLR